MTLITIPLNPLVKSYLSTALQDSTVASMFPFCDVIIERKCEIPSFPPNSS